MSPGWSLWHSSFQSCIQFMCVSSLSRDTYCFLLSKHHGYTSSQTHWREFSILPHCMDSTCYFLPTQLTILAELVSEGRTFFTHEPKVFMFTEFSSIKSHADLEVLYFEARACTAEGIGVVFLGLFQNVLLCSWNEWVEMHEQRN